MSTKSAPLAAGAVTFPRIVKMFNLPEAEAPKPRAARMRDHDQTP